AMARFAVGSSRLPLTVSLRLTPSHRQLIHAAAKLTLIVLIATVLAQAQDSGDVESGTSFQGRIWYENNAPAQFVKVELWTDGETSWRTFATSDRMGRFRAGAPCMVIQYKIDVPGFRPVWGRVDMSMKPCHTFENITLTTAPGATVPGAEGPPSSTINARI